MGDALFETAYNELSAPGDGIFPNGGSHHNNQGVNEVHSPPVESKFGVVVRPCSYILPALGLWVPGEYKTCLIWRLYRLLVMFTWFCAVAAILCLDFVHYGFNLHHIHVREVLNNVCTCLNFLCPYWFTLYYFDHGQFDQLLRSVQMVSQPWYNQVKKIAGWYTVGALILWCLCTAFLVAHWVPFFSQRWHYVVYLPIMVFMCGWWAAWLTLYGYVCHVHSVQVDMVIEKVRVVDARAVSLFMDVIKVQKSLERTQKDFNLIISLAIAYHTIDLIVFSFAYFNAAFGKDYPLWQYVGAVLFDLISLVVKLYPPAVIATAVRRLVVELSKRCRYAVTEVSNVLPTDFMQLFHYMATCEPDCGLKIFGIRITVEVSMTILSTIGTLTVSFVAFVVPKLK